VLILQPIQLKFYAQQSEVDDMFFTVVDTSSFVLSIIQKSKLQNVKNRATTAEVNIVMIKEFDLLLVNDSINLNLFPDLTFTFEQKKIDKRNDNDFTWYGSFSDQGKALFVVKDKNVTGTINVIKEIFKIEPLGLGLHAIIRVDKCKFPPEHPPEFKNGTLHRGTTDNKILEKTMQGGSHLTDVLVAYTPSAANASGDINGLIQTAISETNQSYENSDVSVKLYLIHSVQVNYTESGSFQTDLNRFEGTADGYMDEIHDLRDQYAADVCVLIINNSDYCGLASTIYADATTAFCVVHYDCATGYYSFGHEIGHLQGARHDMGHDDELEPFPYGHGYIYTPDDWRTIMAYNDPANCPGGYCDRIQYWSNPDIYYGGVAMGTITREDNARVLDETESHIKGFRSYTSSGTLSHDETWSHDHSITGNITVPSGVTLEILSDVTVNLNNYYIKQTGGTINRQSGSTFNPDIRLMKGSTLRGQYPSSQAAFADASSNNEVRLYSSETWNSNLTVTANVKVISGKSLSIAAGKTIYFNNGKKIRVYGTFYTLGSGGNRVTLTSASGSSPGSWDGIWVYGWASIDRAKIEYATYGVRLQNISGSLINHTKLSNNCYGIYSYSSYWGSANVQVTGNVYDGVYAIGDWFQLTNSKINNNGGDGFYCEFASPTILANEIIANSQGVSAGYGTVDMGTDCGSNMGYNSIYFNSGYEIESSANVYAYGNWWGSPSIPWHEFAGTVYAGCPLDYDPNESALPPCENIATMAANGDCYHEGEEDSSSDLELLLKGCQLRNAGFFVEAADIFKQLVETKAGTEIASYALMELAKTYGYARLEGEANQLIGTIENYLENVATIHKPGQKDADDTLYSTSLKLLIYEYMRLQEIENALEASKIIIERYPDSKLEEFALFDQFNIYLELLDLPDQAAEILATL